MIRRLLIKLKLIAELPQPTWTALYRRVGAREPELFR